MTGRRGTILAIFVLSGAAGLVYEVVWSRELVLVFGNTTQAVSAILTGFFGGMAIGSWIGGRIADRVRRPLRLYGLLELGLVAVVLLTPLSFRWLDVVYRGAFTSLETAPQALALTRLALSLLALGPATVLMGATLPTLTRYVAHDAEREFSGAFGRLYAANTGGAIAGTLAAGLILIEAFGLTGAIMVGAGCTATAGLSALALDVRWSRQPVRVSYVPTVPPTATSLDPPATGGAGTVPTDASMATRAGPSRHRIALPLALAFVSGLTSLAFQVLWTRLVAAGTGNSTYVFTTILAVFLTGLAIGAVLFTHLNDRLRDPFRLIAFGQIGAAVFVVLGTALVLDRHVVPPLTPTTPLADIFSTFVAATVVVVLPATILMGVTFPATSALVRDADGHLAGNAGALLAINTLGAICGTFIVPFFIIPAIGSPLTLALVAALDAVVGVALLMWARRAYPVEVRGPDDRLSRPSPASIVVGLTVLAVIGIGVGTDRLFVDPTGSMVRALGGTVYATAEDEIAPVVAGEVGGLKQLWVTGTSMTVLSVDAKLMPILPLMLRPTATRSLVIAFGMGSAYRTALIAGLQTDAVELVPSVPKMFGYYFDDAARFTGDPRGRIVIADGRNYVALTDRRYDIVVVDPPPPIESSGVSVISSLEFYQAARDRLTPGGVMMQWIPYGQTVDEFRSHVATFRHVYRNVIVAFGPAGAGLYMLGSEQPIAFDPAVVHDILGRPGLLADLSSAFDSPKLDASGWTGLIPKLVWIQGGEVARFAGDAPLITDDRPRPEYFLLRHLFGPTSPQVSRSELLSLTASLGVVGP